MFPQVVIEKVFYIHFFSINMVCKDGNMSILTYQSIIIFRSSPAYYKSKQEIRNINHDLKFLILNIAEL